MPRQYSPGRHADEPARLEEFEQAREHVRHGEDAEGAEYVRVGCIWEVDIFLFIAVVSVFSHSATHIE